MELLVVSNLASGFAGGGFGRTVMQLVKKIRTLGFGLVLCWESLGS